MIDMSKLRDAIVHLEEAEKLLLNARRAFAHGSFEYEKLTIQADHAYEAAEVTKSVLAHVEAGIYRAAKQPRIYATFSGGSAVSNPPRQQIVGTGGQLSRR